ncbi:MAG TPA: helix-turn-helix domain-containing protein [Selenomonadales bacterium]|nr:helix-turn-helix domain-containing protein [Selenomonadales bacterium]
MSNHCDSSNENCISQLEKNLSIIGSKWTLLILRELASGTKRFAQLEKALKGISPKTLSVRLQELEKNKIIVKKIYPEVPPRVEYSFAARGESLRKILNDLSEWGAEYREGE